MERIQGQEALTAYVISLRS